MFLNKISRNVPQGPLAAYNVQPVLGLSCFYDDEQLSRLT